MEESGRDFNAEHNNDIMSLLSIEGWPEQGSYSLLDCPNLCLYPLKETLCMTTTMSNSYPGY